MGFLIGLLLVVLFFKVFVGISVGLFKLLMGVVILVAILTLAPIGIALLGLLIPLFLLGGFITIIGFILKIIF